VRLANLNGRLCLVKDGNYYDIEAASEGRFSSDAQSIYDGWATFRTWADSVDISNVSPTPGNPDHLHAPVPRPRQIFAVGLNYSEHARESGFDKPDEPVIFTKFQSSLTGPRTDVVHPGGSLDWEVELVVVIGAGGRNISADRAWDSVAGFTAGQDLSERERQHSGPAPQFSMAKAHAGFSPTGPHLVTIDEIENRDSLALGCRIGDEVVQDGSTADLIFPVSELIARLSRVVELYPGDLIFTGTPAGVGAGRVPPRFLKAGEVLTSWIAGIGELEQHIVDPREPAPTQV
jgi:2-keto-4-pentenoate hydratase/2-oxohepta-3-ene-1,7-dioic acid hydratase in catechol pathway